MIVGGILFVVVCKSIPVLLVLLQKKSSGDDDDDDDDDDERFYSYIYMLNKFRMCNVQTGCLSVVLMISSCGFLCDRIYDIN